MLLSALIGTIGAVSAMAQTNVYSLNAVGYINITAYPGFNMISCPLIASPDNTLNTLLPATNGTYKKWQVWTFNPTANPQYVEDVGVAGGWLNGGTETISPGAAVWLYNPSNVNYTVTFVGTVPTGPSSVTLYPASFNLVSSYEPASGDIVTNSLTTFTNAVKKDQAWVYSGATAAYTEYVATGANLTTNWPLGDPVIPTVGGGVFYYNAQATNNYWLENYSVSQ
jgi:hypothetical protein